MGRRWGVVGGISQVVMLAFAGSAMAASFPCPDFKDTFISDGRLFLKRPGIWEPVLPNAVLNSGGRFIYIIRALPGSERSGILVVKTGRRMPDPNADMRSSRKYVQLVRDEVAARGEVDVSAVKKCEFGGFNARRVVSKFYDEYHDADYELKGKDGIAALATFNYFHSNYKTNFGCKTTNDTGWDSVFPFIRRSNRSQYSFDSVVVATGLSSPLFNFFRSATPHGSSGLADQKVQSIRYTTTNGLACVPIDATGSPGSFLRINDLEGRDLVAFLRLAEFEVTFGR